MKNRKDDFKVLTDREHIIQRPEMYIGSVNISTFEDFHFNDEKIKFETFQIVPGLLKIINEVIDNSIDEAIKSNFKFGTEISINIDSQKVEVSDNGRGIPVIKHEAGYQPFLCWGKAKAGSNFNDDETHIQIGKNGIGSYCSNVFSKKFIGETDDDKNSYKVTFTENALKFKESVTKSNKQGTTVTFYPDLERFNLTEITSEHINAIYQRILCLANIFTEIMLLTLSKSVII